MNRNATIAAAGLTLASTALHAQIAEIPAWLYSEPMEPDLVATVRAALPEARAVNAEFLDPSYEPVITLGSDATVQVSFIDEGAGYRNSLAWVAWPGGALDGLTKVDLDANANGIVSLQELIDTVGAEAGLIYPNASRLGSGGLLEPGDTAVINDGQVFPAGTEISFCLLQNAWRWGNVRGWNINTETTLSFHSADMLNPEAASDADSDTASDTNSSRHAAMLFRDPERTSIILGFEDLHRTATRSNGRLVSDEDFNDSIFVVSTTPTEAIQGTNIASADPAYNPRPQHLFFKHDCCGVDTTYILQETLPERTNVNAEFLNPAYDPNLTFSLPTYVTLSFIGEGAIYQNSLGYIVYTDELLASTSREEIDADNDGLVEPYELRNAGFEVHMVFAHASQAGLGGALAPRESLVLGRRAFKTNERLGFFLVQDGWNDNGTVRDFASDTSANAQTFYTIDAFNPEADPDKRRHVAMLFSGIEDGSVLLGFEDLHRTQRSTNPFFFESDEDFNDNVFCITPLTLGALDETNIPVASGYCPADLNSDNLVNIEDLLIFIEYWFALDPRADFNDDGVVNGLDLSPYIELYLGGCL